LCTYPFAGGHKSRQILAASPWAIWVGIGKKEEMGKKVERGWKIYIFCSLLFCVLSENSVI
jgi:hypothetical protein